MLTHDQIMNIGIWTISLLIIGYSVVIFLMIATAPENNRPPEEDQKDK